MIEGVSGTTGVVVFEYLRNRTATKVVLRIKNGNIVITEGSYKLAYTYGGEYSLIKSVLTDNSDGSIETKYYFGDYEKQMKGSANRQLHYSGAGNGLCAIIVNENGVNKIFYAHTDYLGSILAVTDETGDIVARQNFDAWGRKRNPDSWTYNNIIAVPDWLYRGFTGQEHMSQFSLINMNGRIYDPVLGRMISIDNDVSLPWNSQGYNRYAYALNNPLKFSDPSGNFNTLHTYMYIR